MMNGQNRSTVNEIRINNSNEENASTSAYKGILETRLAQPDYSTHSLPSKVSFLPRVREKNPWSLHNNPSYDPRSSELASARSGEQVKQKLRRCGSALEEDKMLAAKGYFEQVEELLKFTVTSFDHLEGRMSQQQELIQKIQDNLPKVLLQHELLEETLSEIQERVKTCVRKENDNLGEQVREENYFLRSTLGLTVKVLVVAFAGVVLLVSTGIWGTMKMLFNWNDLAEGRRKRARGKK